MKKQLQIIDGQFSRQDAIDLIEQIIQVKTQFHLNKISKSSSEEDIKYRERRIKNLQAELSELRKSMELNQLLNLNASIEIDSDAA